MMLANGDDVRRGVSFSQCIAESMGKLVTGQGSQTQSGWWAALTQKKQFRGRSLRLVHLISEMID